MRLSLRWAHRSRSAFDAAQAAKGSRADSKSSARPETEADSGWRATRHRGRTPCSDRPGRDARIVARRVAGWPDQSDSTATRSAGCPSVNRRPNAADRRPLRAATAGRSAPLSDGCRHTRGHRHGDRQRHGPVRLRNATRHARNGSLFTRHQDLKIRNARYRDDQRPIDAGCHCSTCSHFSRAYLHHLSRIGEMLVRTLPPSTTSTITSRWSRTRARRSALGGSNTGGRRSFRIRRRASRTDQRPWAIPR